MRKESIIKIESLTIRNLDNILFSNLNLKFYKKNITVIIGENGVGKSTLLNYLCGIKIPDIGNIFIDKYNSKKISSKIRAKIISSIAQFDTSCDEIYVEERISHGLITNNNFNGLLNEEIIEIITILSKKLKIYNILGKKLKNLSGGERKLTHIARCLINHNAKIYVLDEPFVSLDISHQQIVCSLLKNIMEDNKCIIISTHDINLALRIASRIIIIHNHKIIADGNPEKIINKNLIEFLYGKNSKIFNNNEKFLGIIMKKH